MKEQKNNVLIYKGYYGSIEFSLEDNCLFGSLIGMENGAMTYEGDTIFVQYPVKSLFTSNDSN